MVTLLHMGYHPPRTEPAPVSVEINLDTEVVDRSGPFPLWEFSVQVSTLDGGFDVRGSIAAADEAHAKLLVYGKAIALLAELLAKQLESKTSSQLLEFKAST